MMLPCQTSVPLPLAVLLVGSTILSLPAGAAAEFKPLPPWGDSLFGEWEVEGSAYRSAGLHNIRHAGWSWNPIRTSTPLCSTSYINDPEDDERVFDIAGCVQPRDQCDQMGGSLLDYICMEDPAKPFTVLSPDCWHKKCSIGGLEQTQQTCESTLGGAFAGAQAFGSSSPDAVDGVWIGASWCFVPGRHTVLGPACYGETCFTEELETACRGLGGTVYADLYCVLDSKYTVVGPICQPSTTADDALAECFTDETVETCTSMGGTTVGDIFCVLEGDYSALGPFCYGFGDDYGSNVTECFADRGLEICSTLGGTSFGEGLFCVIEGNNYHVIADYWGGGCIGIGGTDSFDESPCVKDFGGMNLGSCGCVFKGEFTVGTPLVWGTTYFQPEFEQQAELPWFSSVAFILSGSYTLYGPNCYGQSCYIVNEGCEEAGGMSIGGIFCAIPESTKTSFSFSTDEGLPGGIILILSLLSAIVFLESLGILYWWRKERLTKGEKASDEGLADSQPSSDPNPMESPLKEADD